MLIEGKIVVINLIEPTSIENDYTKTTVVSGKFVQNINGLIVIEPAAYMDAKVPYVCIPQTNISSLRIMWG